MRCESVSLQLAEIADGTNLTMHLAYDGSLWTGGLLDKVLEEEIRRARAGLVRLLALT